MQFKHPEVLYFLFLLVIPILVHLFQLRKFKKEYFTNVKFLKELAIQTRKSSKIKKYLLLCTRLLLLTALIFAFAQPFFKAKDSKNATNEMYIVLDNSFSMQAKGKKGELLKRAIQDLLEHTPENLKFSLLTSSNNYWNTDIRSVQKDLQNLKYSAIPFQANEILAKINAHKSAFNRDIVFITDGVGLNQNALNKNKEDNLYFVIPKAEQINNLAIDSVFIHQTLDAFYEIGVKLDAFGKDSKDIPIALYDKNKLIAKTVVSIESKSNTVYFTIPRQDFKGYVSIVDNGLEYDNTYYFNISKPQKIAVLSIGEPEKSNFLSRIYTSDEFNYSNFKITSLDYNAINEQDVVVLNELKDIPQALQTTLKSFVAKGGNVILIPSSESTITNLNDFLTPFGAIRFNQFVDSEKKITKINFGHPLFNTVFEKKITNFQYPIIKKSFDITSKQPVALLCDDQSPFLTSIQEGIASVYVFVAPLNKENSNLQNSPLIVPIFYNMAQNKQLTGVNAFTIGSNTPFIVESKLSKDEILTIKNSQETFIPIQQVLNNKVKLTCNDNPTQAGNFTVFNQEKAQNNISFNYSRAESNLTMRTDNLDYTEINDIPSIFTTLETNRTDQQFWKTMVLIALLCIILEILIQKYVK